MNEIQKFKEGRRIGKYQNPAGPLKPSNPWDEYYSQVYTPGGDTFAPTTRRVEAPVRTERTNQGSTTFKERRRMAAQGAYNAQVRAGLRNPAEDMVPIWQRKPAEQAVVESVEPEEKPKGGTGGVSGKVNRRPKVNYAAKFVGMNFTDEEKKYMTDAGFDPTNAKSVQEFILSKAAGANLGARKGVGIADGYWGDKSAAAFQALRNQGIFTPKVDAAEPIKPVSQTPVDAPDFGYKSEGNYSLDQAGTLKANGIRDWSSLVNYAGRNKDSDFTKLLSGYFGTNDITQWDRNKLESDAKIHGNYHGQDRSQLQGFLGGLQARNNQQYYDKVAAYAKQNPTPTTPRFDFSKISKLEVPEFKFNLSNAGASTLGNNMGLV